jgi:hypothetical protein
MKIKMPSAHRVKYSFSALLMAAAVVLPSVFPGAANAAMLEERSITMDNASAAAEDVTYKIGFTTSASMQSLVIDFCSDSPIIGNTCTPPTDFDVDTATVAAAGSLTGWTIHTDTDANTLRLSGSSQTAGAKTVDIGNIDNPSTVGTFYARIYTYANNTFGGYTGPATANLGTTLDEGSVALSTTNQVSVSGTVQETLTFCVASVAIATSCAVNAPGNLPALELGDGDPKVLTTTPSTGNLYSELSTNAANGASIRMRTSNTCGGLMRAGASVCDIAAIGDAVAPLSGASFGLRVTSAGGLDAVAPYNNATQYGMDDETALENVTTAYGDIVAESDDVLDAVDTTYTFAAQAGNTTPAGLYTANLTLIAVGTY